MTRIRGIRRFFRIDGDGDIDDELQFHLATRADDLERRGMDPEAARKKALEDFGDWRRYYDETLGIHRDFTRETRMKEFLQSVASDLGYAVRGFRRAPAFTATALVTLALGVGATVAVFSAVSGVILRPLPYTDADRIVHIGERDLDRPGRGQNTSAENAYDWQRMAKSFQAMGLYSTFSLTLTNAGPPARLDVANVTPGMFDVFHVVPLLGRRISTADTMQGASPVLLVSHDFWRTSLGSDSAVLGKPLQLNFNRFEIIGVLPAGFRPPGALDRPLWANFVNDTSDGRSGRSKNVYALLAPGVSARDAGLEMTLISQRLAAAYPAQNKGSTAVVDPLADMIFGDVRRPLFLLLGASGLLLLIACANISNLLVARGIARGREVAMRAALGAGRGRLTRQLLTENFVLSFAGCIAGVALASAALRVLAARGPSIFELRPPAIDGRVLAFAFLLSVATTLLFGLLPALRVSRRGLYDELRQSTRVAGGGARTRSVLALTQLAMAVVLLAASALVLRSFAKVLEVEPGVQADNRLYANVWLPRMRYDSSRSAVFYEELERRLRGLPGVLSVGMTSQVPFSGYFDRIGISRIGGRPQLTGSDAPEADRYVVTPSYFKAMGVELVSGRLLEPTDRYESAPVAVVDEAFAKRAFPGQNPLGQTMKLPIRPEMATVVGVVRHVKTYGLDVASPGQIYMSNAQYPWRWMAVVVHTSGDPMHFAPTLARTVMAIDPDQPIANVSTMEAALDSLLRSRRFTMTLLGAFAVAAILLSSVGLYGVIAYGVTQRQRELGVRVALGAPARALARMVIGEGARIAVAGALVGLAGAVAVSKLLSSLLFDVDPRDPVMLAGVATTLVAVALLACLAPARRAMRTDAAEVLRGD
jgi:putative ABC transport system permease protein